MTELPTHLAEGVTGRTLNLKRLAGLAAADEVRVGRLEDRTQEIFEQTVQLLDYEKTVALAAGKGGRVGGGDRRRQAHDEELADRRRQARGEASDRRYMPEHADLRERFIFAQALGSYETVGDLLDIYSPGQKLSSALADTVRGRPLLPGELLILEDYQQALQDGLANANFYLREHPEVVFGYEEISQIHGMLLQARDRCRVITEILGAHFIHQIEEAVHRLLAIHEKMRAVERSAGGVFFVDSEILFIPAEDLIEIVKNLFKGMGNAYVSENVDGTLLLVARNLLIEIVAFYSYYGREQIATLFKRLSATTARNAMAHQVRVEIRKLFQACKSENKLILKRVMDSAERDFEMSVEAIQFEAEQKAVAAMYLLIPAEPQESPAPKKKETWVDRIVSWLIER